MTCSWEEINAKTKQFKYCLNIKIIELEVLPTNNIQSANERKPRNTIVLRNVMYQNMKYTNETYIRINVYDLDR